MAENFATTIIESTHDRCMIGNHIDLTLFANNLVAGAGNNQPATELTACRVRKPLREP
jgi:hypothetical protein